MLKALLAKGLRDRDRNFSDRFPQTQTVIEFQSKNFPVQFPHLPSVANYPTASLKHRHFYYTLKPLWLNGFRRSHFFDSLPMGWQIGSPPLPEKTKLRGIPDAPSSDISYP